MIRYVPFLKLKQNEIMSIKELENGLIEKITPFFDYAKRKNITEKDFIITAAKLAKALKRHAQNLSEVYLDNYDIESNFQVSGEHNYLHLLSTFNEFSVIPVVSIDRSTEHNQAVSYAKDNAIVTTNILAIRLTPEDFQDFDLVEEDIEEELDDIIEKFEAVDLIIDCRVCKNNNPVEYSKTISSFIPKFCDKYHTRRIILTGSSIPASIKEITGVESTTDTPRVELDIYNRVVNLLNEKLPITLGDYCTVSPNYSDIDIPPGAMQNITAPKIIYTYDGHHHIIRGGALRTHKLGHGQYKFLLQQLLAQPFFRGEGFSSGDTYLAEKSRGEGKNATPTTMVKPLCNSHISYMCKNYV
jgi:hypothetical protein